MCLNRSNFSDPAVSVVIDATDGPYMINTAVSLNCIIDDGFPTPTVQWFHDGAATVTTNIYSFTVAVNDHQKTFTCHAINVAGTVSADMFVEIHCKILNLLL